MSRRGHTPVRTCVVCGRKQPKSAFVRLALDSQEEQSIVMDREQILEGRGAYVCPDCVPRLRFTKRVQKAFRSKAKGLAPEVLHREPAC